MRLKGVCARTRRLSNCSAWIEIKFTEHETLLVGGMGGAKCVFLMMWWVYGKVPGLGF